MERPPYEITGTNFVSEDVQDSASPVVEVSPAQPEESLGYVVHELNKPITVDGKEIRKIVLDFDSMSGDAMQNIESEMRADGNMVAVLNPVSSATYCQYIAARAAKMNVADIRRLSFKDNAIIVMRVQNFITN
ncbi:MAG: phage tail assembly protein [Planctomycetaceae bacterium]|nr:phage tail assembly protein [Planctomycetaceae bacterium]